MRRVEFAPEAMRDLDEIWVRIAMDSTDAADKLVNRIIDAAEVLAGFPGAGHQRADVGSPQYRFWPVGKYVIAYRFAEAAITVVRVIHGARDFRQIFNR